MEGKTIYSLLKKCHERIVNEMAISKEAAFDELTKYLYVKWEYDSYCSSDSLCLKIIDLDREFECVKKLFPFTGLFTINDKINLTIQCRDYVTTQLESISTKNTTFADSFERLIKNVFQNALSRYYSDRKIVKYMQILINPNYKGIVCDPCCGSGGLLMYDGDNHSYQNVYGCDTNPRMVRVAKLNLLLHGVENSQIYKHNGLSDVGGIFENQFDMVLMQPPYGIRMSDSDRITNRDLPTAEEKVFYGNKYEGYVEAITKQQERASMIWKDNKKGIPYKDLFKVKVQDLDCLFIERALRLLKPRGRAVILIPQSILFDISLRKLRQYISTQASILNITSLTKIKIGDTYANQCILYLEKLEKESKCQDSPLTITYLAEDDFNDKAMEHIAKEINDFSNKIRNDVKCKQNKIITFTDLKDNWTVDFFFAEKVSFSGKYHLVRLDSILKKTSNKILLKDDGKYRRITIRSNNGGVFLRDEIMGKEIKQKKQFVVHAGEFVVSRLDAKNGGLGIVPSELDNAVVSSEFMTFEIDKNIVDSTYLNLVLGSKHYQQIFRQYSTGTSSMTRMSSDTLLRFQIPLPSLNEQKNMIKRIIKIREDIKEKEETLKVELKNFYKNILV